MNIGIIGSEGYIASFLIDRLAKDESIKRVLKFDKAKGDEILYLDLEDVAKFDFKTFDNIDFIVFTAAISGPDMCAKEFEKCWNINVTGTEIVIEAALKRGVKVLFLSSDAVYGKDDGNVKYESSETKADTPYGKMKSHVEEKFRGNMNFKAIRLSYVVSCKDKFVSYCLESIKKDQTMEVFHPFYRNCTTISDVSKTIIWMIDNWRIYPYQFFNVGGRELVSRVRIADEINRLAGDRLNYVIVKPEEDFYERRSAITQMESEYNSKFHIISEASFTEKIARELEQTGL